MHQASRNAKRRQIVHMICPVLLAAILLLAVRGLLLTQVKLPAHTALPGLHGGERVWVSLTAYGLRLPGESLWGYHRWGHGTPQRGDAVVWQLPGNSRLSTGVCRALPGDTIWADPARQKILPARTSVDAVPFRVPEHGVPMAVNPANARLLAYLLHTYEGCPANVTPSGRLFLHGNECRKVRFTRDFYWMETQPDVYLFIPHEALTGRIVGTLFARGARWPWIAPLPR